MRARNIAVAPVLRWSSGNEWYRPVDAYYGPQNVLLRILMLTGLDGVTKPALQMRQGK